jgi:NADPH-dependent curcumin reductase CurA
MATANREIRLKSRPVGLPKPTDFELASAPMPEAGPGQLLVRNLWMSVDPYMRARMIDRKSYLPPYQIGQALDGHAVGEVVVSNDPRFKPGDTVQHRLGWRDYSAVTAQDATTVDPAIAPIQAYLGTLGMPGMTAYVGLFRIGEMKGGETIFVSAASGAVGAIVCQIAKLKGCRVIASAGSDDKIRWLEREVGVDVAFNYKTVGDLGAALERAAPDGLDLDFENVGGAHLEAALDNMKPFGRVIMCGLISQYNATEPAAGPRNMFTIVAKQLTLRGFIVSSNLDMRSQFLADMGQWIADGRIHWQETVENGLENAPKALLALFQGTNTGKMLVRLDPQA